MKVSQRAGLIITIISQTAQTNLQKECKQEKNLDNGSVFQHHQTSNWLTFNFQFISDYYWKVVTVVFTVKASCIIHQHTKLTSASCCFFNRSLNCSDLLKLSLEEEEWKYWTQFAWENRVVLTLYHQSFPRLSCKMVKFPIWTTSPLKPKLCHPAL